MKDFLIRTFDLFFEINELFALSYLKVQQSTIEFVSPSNELYELMVAMCTLINIVCIFIKNLHCINDNDNVNGLRNKFFE